jgi:hypothetical protein
VLIASPHERAWRETFEELIATNWRAQAQAAHIEAGQFTTEFYQQIVAGKPRLDGARAALQALGLANAAELANLYAERKQQRLQQLIRDG